LQQKDRRGPDDYQARIGTLAILANAQPTPDGRPNKEQLSCHSLKFPGRRRGRVTRAQVDGLKRGLAEYEVQHRGIVRLNEEEEDLFERNIKERGTDDDMAGIAPDVGADEVRVPWYCCGDSDLPLLLRGTTATGNSTYDHQEDDLEGIESGKQGPVQQSKQHGGRYGVFGMASRSGSVCASLQGAQMRLSRTQSHSQSP
jgi:hypothetical protein